MKYYKRLSIQQQRNVKNFSKNKVFSKWVYLKQKIRIKFQLWDEIKYINYDTLDYEANCAICKQPMTFDKCNIDHIIPVSKGGQHTMANLQLTHIRCNLLKGNYCEIEQSGSSLVS